MAPVQKEIVKALAEAPGGELSMNDLLKNVSSPSVSTAEVKAAVLPLISTNRIELTTDHRLRLRNSVANAG